MITPLRVTGRSLSLSLSSGEFRLSHGKGGSDHGVKERGKEKVRKRRGEEGRSESRRDHDHRILVAGIAATSSSSALTVTVTHHDRTTTVTTSGHMSAWVLRLLAAMSHRVLLRAASMCQGTITSCYE
eukprot:52829-Rhodomonas_salina.3